MIITSSFNDGFMTKFNTIDDISPAGNPYLKEMMFDENDENDRN